MIKTVDVDSLFDTYISDYVYKNIGKVKPEEIENKIPMLYVEFGKTALKELDGKTPEEYYKSFTGEELVCCLKGHLQKGVAVSDFLCEAITGSDKNESALLSAIDSDADEEFTLYAMNMLISMNSQNCYKRFLEMIVWDYSPIIKELATEYLRDNADSVKEEILSQYQECDKTVQEYLTEILAGASKDDKIFDILVAQFAKNQNNIPVYANYLAKYGDERALPFLINAIENEKVSYADFEELRFAIEALGGSYEKERDFSKDKFFKKIREQKIGE